MKTRAIKILIFWHWKVTQHFLMGEVKPEYGTINQPRLMYFGASHSIKWTRKKGLWWVVCGRSLVDYKKPQTEQWRMMDNSRSFHNRAREMSRRLLTPTVSRHSSGRDSVCRMKRQRNHIFALLTSMSTHNTYYYRNIIGHWQLLNVWIENLRPRRR